MLPNGRNATTGSGSGSETVDAARLRTYFEDRARWCRGVRPMPAELTAVGEERYYRLLHAKMEHQLRGEKKI